jgi:hypothetical protein
LFWRQDCPPFSLTSLFRVGHVGLLSFGT